MTSTDLLHALHAATERYLSVAADPGSGLAELIESESAVVETASALAGLAGARPIQPDAPDPMVELQERRFGRFYRQVADERTMRDISQSTVRTIYASGWDACRREIFTGIARSIAARRVAALKNDNGGTSNGRDHHEDATRTTAGAAKGRSDRRR